MWFALSSQACCLSTFPEGKPRPWHTHSPALADRKALGPRGEAGKLVVNLEAKTITIVFKKIFLTQGRNNREAQLGASGLRNHKSQWYFKNKNTFLTLKGLMGVRRSLAICTASLSHIITGLPSLALNFCCSNTEDNYLAHSRADQTVSTVPLLPQNRNAGGWLSVKNPRTDGSHSPPLHRN